MLIANSLLPFFWVTELAAGLCSNVMEVSHVLQQTHSGFA